MASRTLEIPAGTRFDLVDGKLVVEHPGDVRIAGQPGQAVARVVSTEGNVYLEGPLEVGEVRAAQSVRVSGGLKAQRIIARDIALAGEVAVGALRATGKVDLGASKVQIDLVIAPRVDVGPKATGRVAVVETFRDLPPNALKGCFRLTEFADITGQNPGELLARHEVEGLSEDERSADEDEEPSPAAPAELEPPAVAPPPAPAAAPPVAAPAAAPRPPTPVPVQAAVGEDRPADEETAEEPAPESALNGVDEATHQRLVETVDRIAGCYPEGDVPPPVSDLQTLIHGRRYVEVRDSLAGIWNKLLKFHQKTGRPFQQQVTPAFNTINSIVRKLELTV